MATRVAYRSGKLMEIIIDTNILFGNWMLKTDDSKAFLDFVERTGSIIYLPRIVWEEIQKNYRNDIAEKHAAYEAASKQFGSRLVEQPVLAVVALDYDAEASKYLTWLQEKLRFNGLTNILPYGDFTARIADRAMAKRKPFNMQNHNEYKDALVWETILDVVATVAGRGDEDVVLISNDTNAFGVGAAQAHKPQPKNRLLDKQLGVLHPQLQEDVDASLAKGKASNFYYYVSFAEFLAAHYIPIKGINSQGVHAHLLQPGFAQVLLQAVEARLSELTLAISSVNPGATIYVDATTIKVSKISPINDFYVYPFQRGEKTTASGTVFVYLDLMVEFSFDYNRWNTSTLIHPIIEVKFTLPYVDHTPTQASIEILSFPVGAGMRLPEPAKFVLNDRYYNRISEMVNASEKDNPNRHIIWDFYKKAEAAFWDIDEVVDNENAQQLRRLNAQNVQNKLKNPTSRYIPQTGPTAPLPKNIPSKRKKRAKKK